MAESKLSAWFDKWFDKWSKGLERVVFLAVVVALAFSVLYLVLTTDCRWKDGCGETTEGESAFARDINRLTETILPRMAESQADIRSELERMREGIAPDIADEVYAKLRQEALSFPPPR